MNKFAGNKTQLLELHESIWNYFGQTSVYLYSNVVMFVLGHFIDCRIIRKYLGKLLKQTMQTLIWLLLRSSQIRVCIDCQFTSSLVLIRQDWWMDDLGFYILSTLFHSYQDNGWMIMKGCVQWNPIYEWKDPRLRQGSKITTARSVGQRLTYWPSGAPDKASEVIQC